MSLVPLRWFTLFSEVVVDIQPMDQRMVAFACRCSILTASGSKNFTHWVGLTPAPTNRPLALSPFCRRWKPSSTRSLAIKTYQTSNVSVPLSLYPFHWTYMPSIFLFFTLFADYMSLFWYDTYIFMVWPSFTRFRYSYIVSIINPVCSNY